MEGAIEENTDRINIMEDHLKNVQQELVYTQSRVRIPPPVLRGCFSNPDGPALSAHTLLSMWSRKPLHPATDALC